MLGDLGLGLQLANQLFERGGLLFAGDGDP
jgi:hypothetical protein